MSAYKKGNIQGKIQGKDRAAKKKSKDSSSQYKKIVAKNRRAYFEYTIEDVLEAGIVLLGSEVKSIRDGKVNITDSHAAISTDFTPDTAASEVVLYNCNIAEYHGANQFNHRATRPRKLLLHKREIKKIIGKVKLKGYTLIALSMYFNEKNKIKMELGIAKGKKLYDKRDSIKQKDLDRDQNRSYRVKDL